MFKDFPKGANLTIIKTSYNYPKKISDNKYDNGSIEIVFLDRDTGKKHLRIIEDPLCEYYIMKKEYREEIRYNQICEEEHRLEKVVVPYKDLLRDIAEKLDCLDFFYNNIRTGNRRDNQKLLESPYVFSADYNIEDFYRIQFSKYYKNDPHIPSKSFLDIETDNMYLPKDKSFPDLGEVPINVVTIISSDNSVYTLVLRNKNNLSLTKFEEDFNEDFFTELRMLLRDHVGGWKNEIRYKLNELKYKLFFYNEEIHLLVDLFKIINTDKPDMVLCWNMEFDIPYIIERIRRLGYAPEDVMCHQDFKNKKVKYFIDDKEYEDGVSKFKPFNKRGSTFNVSCYSNYIDQLVNYASRRTKVQEYNLEYVGMKEAKVGKLSWGHICSSFAEFVYKDAKTFIIYNIIDTIVQKCVEIKTGDIDYLFTKSTINNTRYDKCHRQTVYLVNRARTEWENNGYIIGNNANKNNEKEGYPGALVAEPELINDYARIPINNTPTYLFDNCNDFDYKSLYPYITREFNLSPTTQIGKILIDEVIYENENMFKTHYVLDKKTNIGKDYFSRGGKYIDDLHSENYLDFCHRWLKFGNYNELVDDVCEMYGIEYDKIHTHHQEYISKLRSNDFNKPLHEKIKLFYRMPNKIPEYLLNKNYNININNVVRIGGVK